MFKKLIQRPWDIKGLCFWGFVTMVIIDQLFLHSPQGRQIQTKIAICCFFWLSFVLADCLWRDIKNNHDGDTAFVPSFLIFSAIHVGVVAYLLFSMMDNGNVVMGTSVINGVAIYYAVTIVSTAAWLRGRFRARRFRRIMAQRRGAPPAGRGKISA